MPKDCEGCKAYMQYIEDHGMEELNRQNAELRAYLTAALAQLADKEGQVCRARVLIENRYTPAALWLEELLAALSSPSPCRHEEEAKRLRETLDAIATTKADESL